MSNLRHQMLVAWYMASTVDQYAKKKRPEHLQPSLFEHNAQPHLDGLGPGRWITIGAEDHHGHHVFMGTDGKMKTGAHAGQTMDEAFGKKTNAPEKPDSSKPKQVEHKPIPFRERNAFADELAAKGMTQSEIADAMIERGIAIVDARKHASDAMDRLAETAPPQGEAKEPNPHDDSTPITKPKGGGIRFANAKTLGDVRAALHEGEEIHYAKYGGGDQYEVRAAIKGGGQWGTTKRGIVATFEPVKEEPKPGIVEAAKPTNEEAKPGDQLGLFGEADRAKRPGFKPTLLGEESKGKQGSLFDTKGDPDQMMMFDDGVTPEDRLFKGETEAKADEPTTPSEKAASAHDEATEAGKSPRQAAEAAQKKLDADYEFARASEIGNAGEDLKGSARHKVNAWKGLAEAEKDGTAAEMVTRDQLAKLEPHNLMVAAEKSPLTALAMHYALRSFPPKPGTGKGGDHKKDREQYLQAYRDIKAKAEELVKDSDGDKNPIGAVTKLNEFVRSRIDELRGAKGRDSMSQAGMTDRYNQTANDLVNLHRALATGYRANKTGVVGRLNEFASAVQEKYGKKFDDINELDDKREAVNRAAEHAKDIIEGHSLNKTFGKQGTASSKKRFDPAERYVKIAKREGGRDLKSVTSDPNKATKHLVDSFGMRGVQWGNTVTDEERKHHAAKAVEALTDLADVVGLHPKDIALGGKLGLAIGARGKGTASAHYEPGSQVINLTRASGVGTLAHEWGHGFDHMLNEFNIKDNGGDYMSESFSQTHELYKESEPNGRTWKARENDQPSKGWSKRERPLLGIRKAYAEWSEASKSFRTRLSGELKEMVRNKVMSAKRAEYWDSGREVFARSFEQHVQHKLNSDGRENTYLSGLGGNGGGLWPTAEETKAMASAFDRIFEEYRKHKHGSAEKVKFSRREVVDLLTAWTERYELSQAQRDAGNYRMTHIRLHGLAISIETKKGQRRNPAWPPMPCDYGYVKGTMGKDGDHVDIFVGPDHDSELVVVVDQVNENGTFDEHKALIAFPTTEQAIEAYKAAYTKGWKVGPVTTMTIEQFKAWLEMGNQAKQISKQVSRYWNRPNDDDLRLDETPTVDRYEWNAAEHPRMPAGSPQGGEFASRGGNRPGGRLPAHQLKAAQATSAQGWVNAMNEGRKPTISAPAKTPTPAQSSKKREIAARPNTIRPGHPLHLSALDRATQTKLNKWTEQLRKELAPMNLNPMSKLSKDEQIEKGWSEVDKGKVRELLVQMNQMNRESEGSGVKLHEFVNANGLIPVELAERLDGGSRFFDPEHLGSRLKAIDAPHPDEKLLGVHPEKTFPEEFMQKNFTPDQRRELADYLRAKRPQREEMLKNESVRASIETVLGMREPTPPPAVSSMHDAISKALGVKAPEKAKEPEQEDHGLNAQARNKLNGIASEVVGDGDPKKRDHFVKTAVDAWKQMKASADEHNDALRQLTSFFGKHHGALAANITKGIDPTRLKGFDELVDHAQREYPQLVAHMAGESESGSAEEGLVKALREGIRSVPQPWHDEVIDRAVEMVGPAFFEDFVPEESDREEEPIPFSVRADLQRAVERYWNRGKGYRPLLLPAVSHRATIGESNLLVST